MAVFDAAFLVYLLDPDANPPIDPTTGKGVTYLKERIMHLVTDLTQSGERIIIPTPALSEYLVGADQAGIEHYQHLQKESVFQIMPFDTLAAIELAAMTREAINSNNKKGGSTDHWQKIKLDRQIIAIAKVAGENTIYSGDTNLHKFARSVGITPYSISDLKLPQDEAQQDFPFDTPPTDDTR